MSGDFSVEYLDKRQAQDPVAWKNLSERIVFSEKPTVFFKDRKSIAKSKKSYENICSGSVRHRYILDHFEADTYDYMIGITDNTTGKLAGFLVGYYEDGANEMYIDVICAKPGLGQVLMNRLFQRADALGKNVGLSALPTVLTQYLRYGFTFRSSCAGPSQVPTDEQIQLIRKANVHKMKDTYNSPEIQQVLVELHARDLNVKKIDGCDTAKALNDIVNEQCADDGQSMKRCAPKPKSPTMALTTVARSAKPPSPVARATVRPPSVAPAPVRPPTVAPTPFRPPSPVAPSVARTKAASAARALRQAQLDADIAAMIEKAKEPRTLRKRNAPSRSRSPEQKTKKNRRF